VRLCQAILGAQCGSDADQSAWAQAAALQFVPACSRANSSGALAAVLGEPARAPEGRFHQVGAGGNGAGLVADAGAGERDAAEGGLVGSLRRRILGR
jgi:hypothetical protein